ncbi:polysaccharide biosynthesis C-terminal domain-containing protein [Desemzia sp. FAM 23991]|uniref:putative polysaccharide biosynthesis protein n=1 Tax=unclassified Desemzia TaxID=2685243 RepID=UPI003883A8B4
MSNETISKKTKHVESDSQSKMLSGSAWMSAASIISRLLGAIYIIPWMAWMGNKATAEAANALYTVGYTPYALFLSVATAGVPSAIAKQVSHYNSLGEYDISKDIYKRGLQVMSITGIASAILMYALAPFIAANSPTASAADGTQVIRTLSIALLLIPTMSVTRGYIQGFQSMAPSAISQVVEQIVRVIFMLASVFFIRQVFDGSVVDAVSWSTFGAFVGALASMAFLVYVVWRKQLNAKPTIGSSSSSNITVSTNQILFSIIKTAIPFIIIGAGITIAQLVDQFTFDPIMKAVSDYTPKEIQRVYGVAAANAHKLIMIVLSFGSSMAITSVPLISSLMAKKDHKGLSRQFNNSIQLLFLIIIPASVGMAVVAEPLYTLFYQHDDFGTSITQWSAIMTIFLGLYTVVSIMIMSANRPRAAIKGLVIGVIVKLALQYPLLAAFKTHGMLVSTMIGFAVSSLIIIHAMYQTEHFNLGLLSRRTLLITIFSVIMAIATTVVRELLYLFIPVSDRGLALVVILIVALVGVAVYGYLIFKSRLADKVIGTKATTFRKKLKI